MSKGKYARIMLPRSRHGVETRRGRSATDLTGSSHYKPNFAGPIPLGSKSHGPKTRTRSATMKNLLLAGVAIAGLVAGASVASAADLPARQAPPPAPFVAAIPIFTWTGFYVGAQVGYAWGDNNNDIPGGAFVARGGVLVPFDGGFGGNNDSFLAGVHAGYNYQ